MSQFKLESDLSTALNHNDPLRKGPTPRWKKKEGLQDISCADISANMSSNNSTLNMSLNRSTFKPSPGRINSANTLNAKGFSKSSKSPKDDLARRLTPGRPSDKKSPMKEYVGDRFIPNRSAMQFDLAHYMLTKSKDDENLSPKSSHYKKTMSENLLGEDISNCRILAYKKKALQAPAGHANALKILYSSTKTPGSTKKATRHIPHNPDRILDAPEILDDYYLNIIDWSASDLLAVALHGSLYLWNASSGEINQLLDIPEQEEYISSVSWLNEGNILAVGTSTSEIQLWDVGAEKRIRTMKSHTTRIPSLSWNSYILSSGSRAGVIHHHDVRIQQHHVGTLENHTQEICGLKWSPGGKYLASGGNDNLVNIWGSDVGQSNGRPLHTFSDHQAAVKALAWCPWQPNILASGGGTADRHIRFWNCNLGSVINTIDAKSQVCAILWSKEYKELISGHGFANNELIIWKYPTMAKVAELIGHKSRVLNLAMSPDGTTVVSAGADETLRLWNCFAVDPKKKLASKSSTSSSSEMLKITIR